MAVELVGVPDMLGSADGLRAVSDRIRGDFIVYSSGERVNVSINLNKRCLLRQI